MLRSLLFFVAFVFAGLGWAQTPDSSHLPLVFIELENASVIPDEPKIRASLCIIDNGAGEWNHVGDDCNDYDGWIGIEVRGSSSTFFPKLSYGFETRKADGSNRNVELLGLPQENDWIFHGPYSDKSLLRNVLTYELGRSLGRWAPRTRFCELFLNGQYMGVYVLMEKIKRDKNRVNVAEMSPDDRTGDAITGGYILKIDKFTGTVGFYWQGEFGDFIQVHYPRTEDLNAAQRSYVFNFISAFEQSLRQVDFNDGENGYRQYIDLGSFVDFLIINELCKNVDGYRLSTFLYKDRDSRGGGKLHMGPLWDFNLSLGNANYCTGGGTEGWVLNFNQFCPQDNWVINAWWDRMLNDTVFVNALLERWYSLREGPLSDEVVLRQVDRNVAQLGPAADRNHERWETLGNYVWPNDFVADTYEAEIDFLKSWLLDRLAWMDAHLPHISAEVKGSYSVGFFSIAPNPFSAEEPLSIRYQMSQEGEYQLLVSNLLGKVVFQKAFGAESDVYSLFRWDGRQSNGQDLPPGIYLYAVLRRGEIVRSGKLQKN
jgi:hypothetical protein